MYEVKYSSEPRIRNFRLFLLSFITDLKDGLAVGKRLFIRDLKARYRQPLLGYLWVFLPPLVTSLAFIVLNSSSIIKTESNIPYPLFVICGTMIWQSFVDGIMVPMKSYKSLKKIFEKTQFPPEIMLVTCWAELLFNLVLRVLVLALAVVIFGSPITLLSGVASFFGFLGAIILGLSLGLFMLPFAALFKDFEQGLPLLISFGFYFTPVAFKNPESGVVSKVMSLNPLSRVINFTRDQLTMGHSEQGYFFGLFILAIAAVIFAWVIYKVSVPFLNERITS